MRPALAALTAVILTASLVAGASAQDGPARRKVVAAGVLSDWPPHYQLGEEGEPSGFAVDVMDELAERAGLAVRYRVYDDWRSLLDGLRQGEVDVIPNLGLTESRREAFAFTPPVETFALEIFVRSETRDVDALEDLKGRRVAVARTNRARELLEGRESLELRVFPDARTAFYELLAGNVDAFVYPGSVVRSMARKTGLAGRVRSVGEPLEEVKRAVAVRKGDRALLARLSPVVDPFVRSADYERIYNRWYGEPERFWNAERVAWLVVVLLGVGLVAFLLWRARTIGLLGHEARERRRAESLYRQLMERASDTITVTTEDGAFVDANPAACELLGYDRETLLGMNVRDIMFEEDFELAPPRFDELAAGEHLLTQRRLRRSDGSAVEVEIAASRIGDGLLQAIGRDLTERRRAEEQLREQQEMLRQAQKMEAIGRLAGGVAHDFNNLLTAILGYTDLLLSRQSGSAEELREIREAAERGTTLTRQLLAFSRRQVLQPTVLDLVEVTDHLQNILRRLLGEDVQLRIEHDEEHCFVEADRGQLEQVLMNLAVNARDAMPEGGQLAIRTGRVEVDEVTARRYGGCAQWVRLAVEDTGGGMDERTRERMFEPFFTTKGRDKGTGLGLATVLGIVEQSGGWIDVHSEPGAGTELDVHLPPAEPPAARRGEGEGEEQSAIELRSEPTAEVLVVEDEPAVRRLVVRTLRRRGHEVHEAGSGEQALAVLDSLERPPQLLVTDVVMPGMSGPQLADRLVEGDDSLAVLFVSGHTDQQLDGAVLERAHRAFLAKPFSSQELAAEVERLLLERRRESSPPGVVEGEPGPASYSRKS